MKPLTNSGSNHTSNIELKLSSRSHCCWKTGTEKKMIVLLMKAFTELQLSVADGSAGRGTAMTSVELATSGPPTTPTQSWAPTSSSRPCSFHQVWTFKRINHILVTHDIEIHFRYSLVFIEIVLTQFRNSHWRGIKNTNRVYQRLWTTP